MLMIGLTKEFQQDFFTIGVSVSSVSISVNSASVRVNINSVSVGDLT